MITARNPLVALTFLYIATSPSDALPSFHFVNDVDVMGNTCPLQTFYHQTCPQLCVTDWSMCPGSIDSVIKSQCSENQQRCGDGQCHSSCQGITNPCSCGVTDNDQKTIYFPCKTTLKVNVESMVLSNKTELLQEACDKKLGQLLPQPHSKITSNSMQSPVKWLSCPPPPEPTLTFLEPMFLTFYVIVGSNILLFLAWHIFKLSKERNIPSPTNLSDSSDTDSDRPYNFHGYKSHPIGTLLFYETRLLCLFWFAILGIMTADNYGVIKNGEQFYLFKTSELLEKCFVAIWVFTAVYLSILSFFISRIRNYFRIRVAHLKMGDRVMIEKFPDPPIFMKGRSEFISLVNRLCQLVNNLLKLNDEIFTVPIFNLPSGNQYFEFQGIRFVREFGSSNDFMAIPLPKPMLFNNADPPPDYDSTTIGNGDQALGLTNNQVNRMTELYGANLIAVKVPSVIQALVDEFSSLLYLYQLMCLWVWFFYNYYQMGLVQSIVIMIAAFIRVFIRIKSESQIKGLAESVDECLILREGSWMSLSSVCIVPGDIISIEANKAIPCDCILLSGEVIIDESMLTGEAMPIKKTPPFSYKDLSTVNHTSRLISGTNCLQATKPNDELQLGNTTIDRAIAITVATNINTNKGRLIQKILFPSQYSFLFTDHLKIVICILLIWGGVCFGIGVYFIGQNDINSWFFGMFVLSEIMSPLLPSALVAGQSVAASRLAKEHGITCVDLPRIMVAGKIKTFCFDKTGTLTKDGLEFIGFISMSQYTNSDPLVQIGLASCHSVIELDGKPMGNPVDIEQFRASNWTFDQQLIGYEASYKSLVDSSQIIKVVKRNPFVHARASMSVIIEDPADGSWHIFAKGSFERCKEISQPNSIPQNFDLTTARLAREGCYVLGLAHRRLGNLSLEEKSKILDWGLDQIECNLELMGLILFRNQLKDDTIKAIADLQAGGTRTVMITGDNEYTGVHVAMSCGMIPAGSQVLLGDVVDDLIEWLDLANDLKLNSTGSLLQMLSKSKHPIELAITGRAFLKLTKANQMRELMPFTRVYARMTPESKIACVELQMERGIVGMCGDGGNDCGALRAAHVGIALSDAEASIVSPFSSRDRRVTSCVTLLRYGRGALASSFSCYKYLILYGEIMAWYQLIPFYFGVLPCPAICVLIDCFIVVLMVPTLALAEPADKLSNSRPTAKLLGLQTMMSTISQSLINLIFLIGAIIMLFRQDFFKCHEFDGSAIDLAKWWLLGDNYESEVVGLVCLFQYINAAATFNFGHRYRKAWYKNYLLIVLYFGMLSLVAYMCLADPNWLGCKFRINCGTSEVLTEILHYAPPKFSIVEYSSPVGHNVMPKEFRIKLFILIIFNCLVNLFIEYFGILGYHVLPRVSNLVNIKSNSDNDNYNNINSDSKEITY